MCSGSFVPASFFMQFFLWTSFTRFSCMYSTLFSLGMWPCDYLFRSCLTRLFCAQAKLFCFTEATNHVNKVASIFLEDFSTSSYQRHSRRRYLGESEVQTSDSIHQLQNCLKSNGREDDNSYKKETGKLSEIIRAGRREFLHKEKPHNFNDHAYVHWGLHYVIFKDRVYLHSRVWSTIRARFRP